MEIFNRLRLWLANLILRFKQYTPETPGKTISLASARSIAILYDANHSDQTRKQIRTFEKSLIKENKRVHLLEYIPEKGETDNLFAYKNFSFFTKDHLNLLHLPKKSAIKNFSEESFDLLLCLSDDLPLYYVSAIAKADFKAGMYNPAYSHIFDLMFDFDEGATEKNLQAIESYLGNIQKN